MQGRWGKRFIAFPHIPIWNFEYLNKNTVAVILRVTVFLLRIEKRERWINDLAKHPRGRSSVRETKMAFRTERFPPFLFFRVVEEVDSYRFDKILLFIPRRKATNVRWKNEFCGGDGLTAVRSRYGSNTTLRVILRCRRFAASTARSIVFISPRHMVMP